MKAWLKFNVLVELKETVARYMEKTCKARAEWLIALTSPQSMTGLGFWTHRARLDYTALIWQKEASDKSDISRKRAKCVCHLHYVNGIS